MSSIPYVPPRYGRAGQKVAAVDGASVSTAVGVTKKPTPNDNRSRENQANSGSDGGVKRANDASTNLAIIVKRPTTLRYQDKPNDAQIPQVLPGVPGIYGQTMATGTLNQFTGPENSKYTDNDYGFRFHYNPASISVSASTQADATYSPADTFIALTGNFGTVSFSFLINRTEDIFQQRRLSTPVLGKNYFYELGTDYDIEWLYRTMNGFDRYHPNGTADLGYLNRNTVRLRFSDPLTIYGFVQSVTYNHIKFTPHMVPMLTLVDFTLTRINPAFINQSIGKISQ